MFSCSLCPLSIRYIPYVVFIGYGSSSHGLAEILLQGRNSGSNSLTNSSHGIAGLNISSDGELVTDSNSVVGIGLSSEQGQGHRSGGINGGISGSGGRRRASVDSPYTSHNTSYNTSQKTGSSPSSMGVMMDQSSPLHAVGSPVIITNNTNTTSTAANAMTTTTTTTTIPPLTSSMATNAVISATTNSTTDTTTTTTTPILPIIPSSPTIRRNSLSSNDLMADLVPINNINDQQVTPLVYPSCIYYPSYSYLLTHILFLRRIIML